MGMDNRRRLVIYACEYIHTFAALKYQLKSEFALLICPDKNLPGAADCHRRSEPRRYVHLHFIKRFKRQIGKRDAEREGEAARRSVERRAADNVDSNERTRSKRVESGARRPT